MTDQTDAITAAKPLDPSWGAGAVARSRTRPAGLAAALLRRFDNAPIRNKILVGFFAIVAVVVAMGGVQLAAALIVREAHTEMVGVVIPHTQALSMIGSQALDLAGHARQLSKDAGSGEAASAAAREAAQLKREIAHDLDKFRSTVRDYRDLQLMPEDEIEDRLLSVRDRLVAYAEALSAELGRLMAEPAPSSAGAFEAAANRIGEHAEAIQELVQSGQQIVNEERAVETTFTDSATAILIWTNIVGVVVVIGCAVGGGYLIANRIARPIQTLRRAAVKLGDGDFAALDHESHTADEIGDLAAAFQETAARLHDSQEKLTRSERLSALGQIAGSVSHELRNPLGMIRNSSDIIRALLADKGLGVERALDRLDHAVERCRVIVSDILEFTRVPELERRPIAIDAWLGGMLDEHEVPGAVAVRRELTAAAAVMLDGTRFRQVLVNLIDNAAQAMTEPGWAATAGRAATVTVRTEAAGPHVRLSIADNGPGIPADKLGRIFEPLYTTKMHGVGLGLLTVRKLVEQHGGTINVESKVGEGTVFTVWLPRTPAPATRATAASLAATA